MEREQIKQMVAEMDEKTELMFLEEIIKKRIRRLEEREAD